mmetsp:Transcript_22038/g.71268  ORF Transcript_22038/g.71268 Transcript_22038/m.71268 type:complete len:244 (-) Transcript_22038:60-791(-)
MCQSPLGAERRALTVWMSTAARSPALSCTGLERFGAALPLPLPLPLPSAAGAASLDAAGVAGAAGCSFPLASFLASFCCAGAAAFAGAGVASTGGANLLRLSDNGGPKSAPSSSARLRTCAAHRRTQHSSAWRVRGSALSSGCTAANASRSATVTLAPARNVHARRAASSARRRPSPAGSAAATVSSHSATRAAPAPAVGTRAAHVSAASARAAECAPRTAPAFKPSSTTSSPDASTLSSTFA